MIDRIQFSTGACATAAAGSATATGYSPHVAGRVLAVAVEYQDSPPAATTDFTLADESDPLAEAIVTLANAATDLKLYPRRATQTNANAALLYAAGGTPVSEPYAVHGRLKATIAQANTGDSVLVTVWLER
jgi:hypothetical protein